MGLVDAGFVASPDLNTQASIQHLAGRWWSTPCFLQIILVYFFFSPNLSLSLPTRPVTISLFSMSVNLFLFCK